MGSGAVAIENAVPSREGQLAVMMHKVWREGAAAAAAAAVAAAEVAATVAAAVAAAVVAVVAAAAAVALVVLRKRALVRRAARATAARAPLGTSTPRRRTGARTSRASTRIMRNGNASWVIS